MLGMGLLRIDARIGSFAGKAQRVAAPILTNKTDSRHGQDNEWIRSGSAGSVVTSVQSYRNVQLNSNRDLRDSSRSKGRREYSGLLKVFCLGFLLFS